MAKKRGKLRNIPKKPVKKTAKKAKIQKRAEKPAEPMPVKDALKELEILTEKSKAESAVEKEEQAIEKKESAIMAEEKKIEKEAEKVEKISGEIKKEVIQQPLKNFTIKDLNKGIIGAFIGVVAHFAFIYGKTIATQISAMRATILLVFSYLTIVILMYETGYREIREKRLLGIFPKRATAIYAVSIVVVVIIFLLFDVANFMDMTSFYKEIAVTSVLASVGAGTADLIGKD